MLIGLSHIRKLVEAILVALFPGRSHHAPVFHHFEDEILVVGQERPGNEAIDMIKASFRSFPHSFVVRLSVVTTQCMITERGGTYTQNLNHELQGLLQNH